MRFHGIKLLVLVLLAAVALDAYAADALSVDRSNIVAFFWDKKLYHILLLIAVCKYFQIGR